MSLSVVTAHHEPAQGPVRCCKAFTTPKFLKKGREHGFNQDERATPGSKCFKSILTSRHWTQSPALCKNWTKRKSAASRPRFRNILVMNWSGLKTSYFGSTWISFLVTHPCQTTVVVISHPMISGTRITHLIGVNYYSEITFFKNTQDFIRKLWYCAIF